MPTLRNLGRVIALSPHLDDAVLSCGHGLAQRPGSTVVTVFAGLPPQGACLPDWDARCGFPDPRQAIEHRREEDRQALVLLECLPVWMDFLDAQYGGAEPPLVIARELAARLEASGAATVLLPLGLFHSDHHRVHEAAMLARLALPRLRWLAYEDVPYRAGAGLVQQRLARLEGAGIRATPARLPPTAPLEEHRKAAAVQAYASQRRGLGEAALEDARAPERCWLLDDEAPEQSHLETLHA